VSLFRDEAKDRSLVNAPYSWPRKVLGWARVLATVLLAALAFGVGVLVLWFAIDVMFEGEPVNLIFRWVKEDVPLPLRW
jgi:hypothetical protein